MADEKKRRENVKKDTVKKDNVRRENVKRENVKRDNVKRDNVSNENVKGRSGSTGLEKRADLRKKPQTGSSAAGIIAVVIIVVLLAAYFIFGPKAQSGSKSITITVTDNTGTDTVYESRTDAEYLIEAVNEIDGLDIQGTESEYGLFINTINGVTADYSVDQSYWAIYVNGEYGNYGIDAQPVADGDDYTFVYEISTY